MRTGYLRRLTLGLLLPGALPCAQAIGLTSAGDLDPVFGTAEGTITALQGLNEGVTALALQDDGHFVVAGSSPAIDTQNRDFALARYDADGKVDLHFGMLGRTFTDFSSSDDHPSAVIVQNDGKLVVAGSTAAERYQAGPSHFTLARHLPDGTLDPDFATEGKS